MEVVMMWVISTRESMILVLIWRFLLTFYTGWGIIFHLSYFLGLLPNTWIIALFILIVSQFFNYVHPNYLELYQSKNKSKLTLVDILLHRIWVFIIPMHFGIDSIALLIISVLFYLSVYRDTVFVWYADPLKKTKEIFTQ